MKHCKEESRVLNNANNISEILPAKNLSLLFFVISIFFVSPIFAQIPVNGFCEFNSLNIDSGFNSIHLLNSNNELKLLLSDINSNQTSLYKNAGNYFSDSTLADLKFTLSKIEMFNLDGKKYFAFTSRKNRKTGYFEINKWNKIVVKKSLALNSYPENLSAGDIDNDGNDEILLSGNSFNGLSILTSKNLDERIIADKRIFSSAVFSELSNDEFIDIAAIDLLSNSLVFLFNDYNGGFEEVRRIDFTEKILNLQSVDFNSDGFSDLIFSMGNNINLICGDSISSYETSLKIRTLYNPAKFIVTDLNSDNLNDIAYINKKEKVLSVIFAKNKTEFHQEIIYSNSRVDDIAYFKNGDSNSIITLNSFGKLNIIGKIQNAKENFSIKIGGKISALTSFRNANNINNDYAFIDGFSDQLKILKRNSSGSVEGIYQIPLSDKFNTIKIVNSTENKFIFHCYKNENKLVEIILIDFKSNSYQKEKIYLHGKVLDLKLRKFDNERPDIYALINTTDGLKLSVISYKNFRYTTAVSKVFDHNVTKGNFLLGKNIDVFYWKSQNSILQYYFMKVNNNFEIIKRNEKFLLPNKYNYNIHSVAGKIINEKENTVLSFINSGEMNIVLFTDETKNYKVNFSDFNKNIVISNKENLFLDKESAENKNNIYFYNEVDSSLYKANFKLNSKTGLEKILSTENINGFIIDEFLPGKKNFIFIDKENNCIKKINM